MCRVVIKAVSLNAYKCGHTDSEITWLLWYDGSGDWNVWLGEKAAYWMFVAFVWEPLLQ